MSVGYQYVVLRLVPSIEREEFLNVGVALYAQMADFLDARFHLDATRLAAFAPTLAAHIGAQRGEPCPGRPDLPKLGQRFGWISAPRSTIVQPGPMHGGVSNDPGATLERLVDRLVR